MWFDFKRCPACHHDLRSGTYSPESGGHSSSQLLDRMRLAERSNEDHQSPEALEYFEALWAVSQMQLRGATRVIRKFIPRSMNRSVDPGEVRATVNIEQVPIAQRADIIRAAVWLLEKWPDRFLSVASKAGLRGNDFSGTWHQQPQWMSEVIVKNLVRRNHRVSDEDVQSAISLLQKEGKTASKLAVRQLIGVSESKKISAVLDKRRVASLEEFKAVMDRFEELLLTLPTARSQQASYLRDYLIFLLSVLGGKTLEEICKFSKAEVDELLQRGLEQGPFASFGCTIKERAMKLHITYSNYVRDKWWHPSRSSAWFISRFGYQLQADALRQRLSGLMVELLSDKLWYSADVFLGVLRPGQKIVEKAI